MTTKQSPGDDGTLRDVLSADSVDPGKEVDPERGPGDPAEVAPEGPGHPKTPPPGGKLGTPDDPDGGGGVDSDPDRDVDPDENPPTDTDTKKSTDQKESRTSRVPTLTPGRIDPGKLRR